MSTLRDEGIEVVPVTGGFRYVLPKRGGKPVRTAGWVIGGFGAFATAFMVLWMSGPLRAFFESRGGDRWFSLVFGLFGLGGLVPGLAMLFGGIGAAAGWSYCEVEVAGPDIKVIERFGLVRWSWSRRLVDLTGFEVSHDRMARIGPDGKAAAVTVSPGFGGVTTISDKPKPAPLHIAWGYPNALVQALANEMSERTKLPVMANAEDEDDEEGDVVAAESAEDRRVTEKPPKSDIVVQALADGVGLSVPPAGLWRGTKGLFVFAIFWDLICTVILVAMILAAVKAGPKGNAPPFPVFVFIGVFIAIGVAIMFAAINMGTRRALMAVTKGVLTIRQIGIYKTREWRFAAGEVAAVRMGRSGMEVNNKPVMELQIVPRDGKKVGVLGQRSDDELLWLAAILRQALNVRSEPPIQP